MLTWEGMVEQLFGSKTRVKLLHLFLSNPDRAFYVREITRKIDEQINSVRRELANMLSIGVIKNDSVDNKLYYKVNKDYEHYTSLKQMFSDEKPSKDEAKDETPKEHPWKKHVDQVSNIRVAVLSGNLTGNPSSGVDVLLVGSPSVSQVKRLMKKFEEEEGRPLNYATLDYDNFYYRLSIKDKFVTEIIDRAYITLLDTDNILRSQ